MVLLFGFMHIGAIFAFFLDRRDRDHIRAEVFNDKCGFALESDAWTWSLEQEDLSDPVHPVKGSAVHFCSVLGLPYARIRSAVPEDTLPTSAPSHKMVGRFVGLSTKFFDTRDKELLGEKACRVERLGRAVVEMEAASRRLASSQRLPARVSRFESPALSHSRAAQHDVGRVVLQRPAQHHRSPVRR